MLFLNINKVFLNYPSYFIFTVLMKITDDLSPEMVQCLKLLKLKTQHNMSDLAFKEMLEIIKIPFSLFKIKKKLEKMVEIQPLRVDMCTKSCCAFTGNLSNLSKCPICQEPRYLIQ